MRCEWDRRGEGGEQGGGAGSVEGQRHAWGHCETGARAGEAAWDAGRGGCRPGVGGFKAVGTIPICTGLGV